MIIEGVCDMPPTGIRKICRVLFFLAAHFCSVCSLCLFFIRDWRVRRRRGVRSGGLRRYRRAEILNSAEVGIGYTSTGKRSFAIFSIRYKA